MCSSNETCGKLRGTIHEMFIETYTRPLTLLVKPIRFQILRHVLIAYFNSLIVKTDDSGTCVEFTCV